MFKHFSHLSLRSLLNIDAATCAAMGLLLTIGADSVARITLLPSALLFYAGAGLFPVALFMAFIAARSVIHPIPAKLIIGGNILWVAASVLLLAGSWVAPNAAGVGFVLVQAAAVAVLAWLEHTALSHAKLTVRVS